MDLDETIKHVWIEVKEDHKNSPYFVRCLYQPSSEMNQKKLWWEQSNNPIIF